MEKRLVTDPELDPRRITNRAEFGRFLEALCQRADLSLHEAARRAGLPVTTLHGYVRGRNLPQRGRGQEFIALLRVLGIHDEKEHDEWLAAIERIRRRPGPEPAGRPVP